MILGKYKYKKEIKRVIYSKCCPCGGDIEIKADYEGKFHLACIQCSKEISKSEATNLLKKLQTKVA